MVALVPGFQLKCHAHAISRMRSLSGAAQAQFQFVGADGDLDRRFSGKRQWHLQVAAAGTQVRQAAMVRDGDAGAVHFGAYAAGIAGLFAPVVATARCAAILARTNVCFLRLIQFLCLDCNRHRSHGKRFFEFHGNGRNFLLAADIVRRGAQKFIEEKARTLRHRHKVNSGSSFPILPDHLPRQTNGGSLPRKLEMEINLTGRRHTAAELHRHPIFGQIHENGFCAFYVVVVKGGMGMDPCAGLAPLITVNYSVGSSQRARGSLIINRLVKNKIDSQREYFVYALLFRQHDDCHAGFIDPGLSNFFQQGEQIRARVTIEKDQIEVILGQTNGSPSQVRARLEPDSEVFENLAKDFGVGLVGTHQERR